MIPGPIPYFSGPKMHHVQIMALPRRDRHTRHHASEHLQNRTCARKLRSLLETLPQQNLEYLRRLDVAKNLLAGLFCRTQSYNGHLPHLYRLWSAQLHSWCQL